MKWQLRNKLYTVLSKLEYPNLENLGLEVPANTDFGDYASNISFVLAKSLRTNPKELARTIASQLNKNLELNSEWTFSDLNGFINIMRRPQVVWDKFLDPSPFVYPKLEKSTLLEYVSANPTGPLHIGHGRWAVIGDVLKRLLKAVGQSVTTEFYINDAGNQIQKLYDSVQARREGREVPEDGYHGQYINELAATGEDPVQCNLNLQRSVLSRFGVEFDYWFSEKSLYQTDAIASVVTQLQDKGHTFIVDNALWFQSTAFGDDKDRVLIKSDGSYTYFLVDLAYHFNKASRNFTHLINIWGADHHGYVTRMKAGVKALGCYTEPEQFVILIGQLVNLFREGTPVRMSKRTGDIVTLEEVIDEIGVDATRYFLVEKSIDSHIDFDLTLAASKSAENPVFYIQYAHARLSNILAKLEEVEQVSLTNQAVTLEKEENNLIRHCLRYPDVVWESATQTTPHYIAAYTVSLAKKVQLFYEKCPVLKADALTQAKRKLIIIQARNRLKQCLSLLGMNAPDKM